MIQSDQKENKSEQTLQIIGHVVAEFYANKRSMHGTICGLKHHFIENNFWISTKFTDGYGNCKHKLSQNKW
jgi:hypothetical protein